MGMLFTPERRAEIFQNLIAFLQADESIVGAVSLGSTASDFRDENSDINLIGVVRNGAIFATAYTKWHERLLHLFPVVHTCITRQSDYEVRLLLLLEHFLILDVHFVKLGLLSAEHKPWHVVFDRTEGDIPAILERTYDEEVAQAPLRVYTSIIDALWYRAMKCAIAIKRGETWHAMHLIETIRDDAVRLAGLNHRIVTDHYQEVDRLPEMFLVHLRHAIPTSTSPQALRRALRAGLMLLFDQAEALEPGFDLAVARPLEKRLITFLDLYS